jgi:hypothetical protein
MQKSLHLVVEAVGRSALDHVHERHVLSRPVALEQSGRERAVRVHAVEAVVRRRHGRREHLALRANEGGAGKVVDEELVGEATQVDAQAGCQPDRGQDSRHIGQAPDDGPLLRAPEALLVTCHPSPLESF